MSQLCQMLPTPTNMRYCNNYSFGKLPFFFEKHDPNNPDSDDDHFEIGIVGIPYDEGCSFRTGCRFGPSSIRTNSCILREYNFQMDLYPFRHKVVDFGDISVSPYDIPKAINDMEVNLEYVMTKVDKYIVLGGDHTISYPSLKAVAQKHGAVSIIHFDSHLDTFDNQFGCKLTHGTPFKRAVEDGLLNEHRFHIGTRGGTYSETDIEKDKNLGFTIYPSNYIDEEGMSVRKLMQEIRNKIGESKLYVSVDIDVVDPAFAPGTGTPEVGGYSSREFISMIRGLKGLNIVGADIVEVCPCYDSQACTTSLLAGELCYEFLGLMEK